MLWNGLAAVIVAAVWLCSSAWGQAADAALITAAKSEGRVTWYTTQIINQFVRPSAEAFETKYGIKVDYVRTNTTELVLRIENESKAGRVQADVFDGTGAAGALKKSGAVLQWVPEAARRFGQTYVDPEGYWAATNVYVLTPGYNTDLIAKGKQPRTYEDLLDAKWKGKIVWNASQVAAAGTGFIGTVLAAMGEEKGLTYLRKLASQNIAGILQAPRAGLDQVIAGEYAIALNIFNHHTVLSAAQGAPSDWIALNPSMGTLSVASVTKSAPHPNAAKLLVDFLVSEEGQVLFRDADYIPVDENVPPRDPSLRPDGKRFSAIWFTPEEVEAKMPHWSEVYRELFR